VLAVSERKYRQLFQVKPMNKNFEADTSNLCGSVENTAISDAKYFLRYVIYVTYTYYVTRQRHATD